MDLTSLLQYSFGKVIETFSHNWPLLLISILISAALKRFVNQDVIARFLRRNTRNSVLISTGVAVATPFCSCGTTAVVLGMMASTIPWAPIIAFMVASPLTSPEELFYSAGLFGWPFAIAFFVSSIVLGLLGGAVATFAEGRGWLVNQARMKVPPESSLSLGIMAAPAPMELPIAAQPAADTSPCGCSGNQKATKVVVAQPSVESSACSCSTTPSEVSAEAQPASKSAVTIRMFVDEVVAVSKRLLPLFVGFTFVGYFINGLIPAAWITSLFGAGHAYGIPLAASLGLPFYINTEASLPLVRAMLDSGMSQGAALAFLITGAGTSIGALSGALTIARWRVLAIVIGTLWAGSILLGLAYDLLIA